VPCWRGNPASTGPGTRGYYATVLLAGGVGCTVLAAGFRLYLTGYSGSTRGDSTALAGGRRLRSTGWVLPKYSRGTARRVQACTAAAASPRAARDVLSFAGAYVFGAAGSNECPAGSVRIETEAACRTASAAAGKTPGSTFVEAESIYPRGCYFYTSGNTAYFNTDAVGAGVSTAQLLCAALATTGAPSPPQTGACSGTPRVCVRIWLYMYRSVCVCACVSKYRYIYPDISISLQVYMHVHVCVSVCVCVCARARMCRVQPPYHSGNGVHDGCGSGLDRRHVWCDAAGTARQWGPPECVRSSPSICGTRWGVHCCPGTPEYGLNGMALSSTRRVRSVRRGTHAGIRGLRSGRSSVSAFIPAV
jgi:hypothetical protein